MTMIYTPRQERILQEDRVKDVVVADAIGRLPASIEERERVWKLLQQAAKN